MILFLKITIISLPFKIHQLTVLLQSLSICIYTGISRLFFKPFNFYIKENQILISIKMKLLIFKHIWKIPYKWNDKCKCNHKDAAADYRYETIPIPFPTVRRAWTLITESYCNSQCWTAWFLSKDEVQATEIHRHMVSASGKETSRKRIVYRYWPTSAIE